MELLQLRYFRTVAKLSSMTKAAELYGIPQPSMSQTVSRLEKELGFPLFDRKSNRLSLNENGRVFLCYAEKSLDAIDDGVNAAKETAEIGKNEVRLLVLQNRERVIKAIEKFSKSHENTNFSICHSPSRLTDFDFDFCISSESMIKDGFSFTKELLLRERIIVAVNVNDTLSEKEVLTAKELNGKRLVSLLPEQPLCIETEKFLSDCGIHHDTAILCDDPYYVRRYVSLGMGVALVPEKSWEGLWDNNVRLIPFSGKAPERSTFLFSAKDRFISRFAVDFKSFLISEFRCGEAT